ncbi:MAG: carboxypeptidase regulatory-like domain-containing protein [Bryobacterales bacterium]|nr:carboxypeptidase regulatory-like domain-containing protein [Bryobacterales bacterium]
MAANRSGDPLAGASVRLSRPGKAGLAADLETDRGGRFAARDLSEGEYRIDVTKASHLPVSVTVRVRGEPSEAHVRLLRLGVITGSVVDAQGQPVRGAFVFAIRDGGQRELRAGLYAAVDARGMYRLYGLTPGSYTVAATYGASAQNLGMTGSATVSSAGSGAAYYPDNRQPKLFTVTDGEEWRADFTLLPQATYTIHGQVEFPPHKGLFWIALAPEDRPDLASAAAQARPDGSFQLPGIAPGSYTVFVSGPSLGRGFRGGVPPENAFFGRARIDVTSEDVHGLVIAPQPALTVPFVLQPEEGTVCDGRGELVLTPLEDWAAELARRVPVESHEFQVDRLAPARYALSASGMGKSCFTPEGAVADLSKSAGPVAVRLVPAGAIAGRASGSAVLLFGGAGEPARVAYPDAEARFAFDELRPGRYRVAVQADPAKPAGEPFPVTVTPGEPVEVDLMPR